MIAPVKSIKDHGRLWVYRIDAFFLLAILSFAAGRTPVQIIMPEAGYSPNWILNRFLWLPYAGSGDMPWELENLSLLGFGNLIVPSILTILWWIFLAFSAFEVLRRTILFIARHIITQPPPVHDDIPHAVHR
ncbi:hypothetical protein ACFLXN_02735 [Chloroflexota bacterium]